jgi:hypothetical protein
VASHPAQQQWPNYDSHESNSRHVGWPSRRNILDYWWPRESGQIVQNLEKLVDLAAIEAGIFTARGSAIDGVGSGPRSYFTLRNGGWSILSRQSSLRCRSVSKEGIPPAIAVRAVACVPSLSPTAKVGNL